jgi:hypothetical protein
MDPKQFERVNLKKQTQFAGGTIGVSSYMKGYYGRITLIGAHKNKANLSRRHNLSKPSPNPSALRLPPGNV